MKITELKQRAKTLGLKIPKEMKKNEIIRAIQVQEGNFPCIGTAQGFCDQPDCLWKRDCLGKKP
jgi:hypothetical protein